MIKETKESELQSFIKILIEVCNRLNNCLPEIDQVLINASLQSIANGLDQVTKKIVVSINNYEKSMQGLEINLRKHIKNQIELKLYYQHLEEVIAGLKKQKFSTSETIYNLKTQLTALKEKEKYYLTMSNSNTRNNQQLCHFQSKLDTIAKIKTRLSLNGTQQFYANYIVKKIDKDNQTKQLRQKRESLANALKQLYESPNHSRERLKDKPRKKSSGKSRDSSKQKQKQKQKSRDNSRGRKRQASKNKGNKVLQHNQSLSRNRKSGYERLNEKSKNFRERKQEREGKQTPNHPSSSRRNSKP